MVYVFCWLVVIVLCAGVKWVFFIILVVFYFFLFIHFLYIYLFIIIIVWCFCVEIYIFVCLLDHLFVIILTVFYLG